MFPREVDPDFRTDRPHVQHGGAEDTNFKTNQHLNLVELLSYFCHA